MNYIDITQNKNTHCIENNTVVITNREGIQGIPGKDGATPTIGNNKNWFINGVDTGMPSQGEAGSDGFSPYISPDTGNWVDKNGDTGVPASGGGEGMESKEILFFYSTAHFPATGVSNIIYVDKLNVKMYSWDESRKGYVPYNDESGIDIYCGDAFSE